MKRNFLDRKVIPIITGPTASGKSSYAIELARETGGTIISADSRQIYAECLIGTARATKEELGSVSIKLSGHTDIKADYSVGTWLSEVKKKVDSILAKGELPIIAGGTPFYIHSLLNGIFESDTGKEVSTELRDELNRKWERDSEALYEELTKVDAKWAEKIEANDRQRVLRGLEFYYTNNKPLSSCFENHKNIFEDYHFELFVISRDRPKLYERINKRVDVMIATGLEEEVINLYEKYGDFDQYNSLKSVGYSEWVPYFHGERSKEEVIKLIKRNSRRYSKRQITFFKNKFPEAEFIEL